MVFLEGDNDLRKFTSATLSFNVPIFFSKSFRSCKILVNFIINDLT